MIVGKNRGSDAKETLVLKFIRPNIQSCGKVSTIREDLAQMETMAYCDNLS